MKRNFRTTIAAIFLALFLSSGGFAQQAEEIKGKKIQDQQGKQLGTVEEVTLGPDGRIESVTVEKGGFLGLGGETNTIPWNALTQANDGNLIYRPGSEQDQASRQQGQVGAQQQQSQAQTMQSPKEAQQDSGQQETAQQGQEGSQQGGGQIAVQQPGAQVKVDQPEAQVKVDQAEPEVSVSQPQPKVTVTQPPPQVKVQIEQPEPQVTVQQPKPEVDVQQQEPKVTVEQPKPEVTVQQQKPEVVVEESKPQVQVGKSGQPQVYLEEQKQAEVQVQRQGEPQVEVVTSGQQQGAAHKMDAAKADELMGRKVIGQNGNELGTLKTKHLSEDGKSVEYLIVQGDDNKLHPVPVALVRMDEEKQQLTARIDRETFQNSPSFSPDQQPKLEQQQWSREIQNYYGISPAWQDPSKQSERQSGQQPQGTRQESGNQKNKQ